MSTWPFVRGVLVRVVPASFCVGAALEFSLIKGNFYEHEKVRYARRRDELLEQFGDFDGAVKGFEKLKLPAKSVEGN